jgi:hypothetical protein
MKIVKNTSDFKTEELYKLFCLIHKHIAKKHKLGKLFGWEILRINVSKKNKGRYHSGCAYVGFAAMLWAKKNKGSNMHLSVNRKESIDQFIHLFGHELYHSYGYEHKDYPSGMEVFVDWEINEIKAAFGQELTLKPEPKKRTKPVNTIWKQINEFNATGRYTVWKCEYEDSFYVCDEYGVRDRVYIGGAKATLEYAKDVEAHEKKKA